jgi:hypothetical protein
MVLKEVDIILFVITADQKDGATDRSERPAWWLA